MKTIDYNELNKLRDAKPTLGGTKHDQGKPQLTLVPRIAIEGEAKVFEFGAQKYERNNFRNGIHYNRLIDACLRHVLAISDGEDIDPESGLAHWAHARCCLAMLAVMEVEHPELDDRYKVNQNGN